MICCTATWHFRMKCMWCTGWLPDLRGRGEYLHNMLSELSAFDFEELALTLSLLSMIALDVRGHRSLP